LAALAPAYAPRRPTETALYAIVREHLETFLAHARENYEQLTTPPSPPVTDAPWLWLDGSAEECEQPMKIAATPRAGRKRRVMGKV
jgi:hypothetical protein